MKKRYSVMIGLISGLLLLGITYGAAQEAMDHQHMQNQRTVQQIKVGKKGEMKFAQETRIGDLVLPPGEYRFVHRVHADDHFVHFEQVKNTARDFGEVRCQVEPLSKKVVTTAVYMNTEGGVRRITKIEVAGENVAHIF
jgi:hypothetical protein